MNLSRDFIRIFLLFSIAFILNSCEKDKPANSGLPPLAVNAKSNGQITFMLDDTIRKWLLPPDGVGNNLFLNTNSLGGPPYNVKFGALLEPNVGSLEEIVLYKGTCLFSSSPDSSSFVNFFPVQNFPYSPMAANGVKIAYSDVNGKLFSTDLGNANQTGSSFRILDTYYSMVLGDQFLNVHVAFNCKVYDTSGAFRTITNGNGVFTFKIDF